MLPLQYASSLRFIDAAGPEGGLQKMSPSSPACPPIPWGRRIGVPPPRYNIAPHKPLRPPVALDDQHILSLFLGPQGSRNPSLIP